MVEGGIYDQVGGGFARYSTDTEWLAPHFEKMLYDNAMIVNTLCEAYQLTSRERYKKVIEETVAFVERELIDEAGGFYSALDADSEGEEGKFYVWDKEDVKPLLGEDFELFADYFDITDKGNWEHKNILRVKKPLEEFAKEKNVPVEELERVILKGKEMLLAERSKRVRPGLDDKVILGWNALMNQAFSKAYGVTSITHYRAVAERNMEFLLSAYAGGNGMLRHTWKKGEAKYPAFLDDYANLLSALLELGQVTGRAEYLEKAKHWTEVVVEHFEDEESPLFFYTHKGQKDVLVRKKELYDGATPSGNATMALNLYHLSIFFDIGERKMSSEQMVRALADVTIKYPTSFGVWLSVFLK